MILVILPYIIHFTPPIRIYHKKRGGGGVGDGWWTGAHRFRLQDIWSRGYKILFVLNSIEHDILNAHKYKKYQEIRFFFLFFFLVQISLECFFSRS